MLQLKSYIHDSMHLIEILDNVTLPQQTIIVFLNVESLYTKIDHQVGVAAAVMYFLDLQTDSDRMHDSLLVALLNFVLRHNYFTFDKRFYKQVSGTAMGAICAPSYANIFLGWWECTLVYHLQEFHHHVLQWHRYIDDIVFFWTGSLEQCVCGDTK